MVVRRLKVHHESGPRGVCVCECVGSCVVAVTLGGVQVVRTGTRCSSDDFFTDNSDGGDGSDFDIVRVVAQKATGEPAKGGEDD